MATSMWDPATITAGEYTARLGDAPGVMGLSIRKYTQELVQDSVTHVFEARHFRVDFKTLRVYGGDWHVNVSIAWK